MDDKVFEDYVLRKITAWHERYPPKKGKKGDGDKQSREDEDNAGEGGDGGVEYEDDAQLQPSDGEYAKQEAISYNDKHVATDQQDAASMLRRLACLTRSK